MAINSKNVDRKITAISLKDVKMKAGGMKKERKEINER